MTTNKFGNILFTKSGTTGSNDENEIYNKPGGSMMKALYYDDYSDLEFDENEEKEYKEKDETKEEQQSHQREADMMINYNELESEYESSKIGEEPNDPFFRTNPYLSHRSISPAKEIPHSIRQNSPASQNDPQVPDIVKNFGVNEASRKLAEEPTLKVSSQYHKYGIGAKLMMKMGYQEGKGLGNDQSGIVEPIDAVQNKGKFGLGASSRNKSVLSDEDEDDNKTIVKDHEQTLLMKKTLKLTTKAFFVINKFERTGVELPNDVIKWANNLKNITTDQELIDATRVYDYLDDIWDDFYAYNEKESTLKMELDLLNNNNIENRLSELNLLQNQLKTLQLNMDGVKIDDFVQYLSKLSISDDDKVSTLLTIVQQNLDLVINVPLASFKSQETLVTTQLNNYATFFTNLSSSKNFFFNYLFHGYSQQLKELLEGAGYSREADEDLDKLIITILSIWVNNFNSIMKEKFMSKLFKALFVNYIMRKIKEWELFSIETLSKYVDDYLIIISTIDDSTHEKLHSALSLKIKNYLDFENINSLWHNLQNVDHLKFAKTQLLDIFQTWIPRIKANDTFDAQTIIKSYERSFAKWKENKLSLDQDQKFVYDCCFEFTNCSNLESNFNTLQYLLFNRWIEELVKCSQPDPEKAIEYYTNWFNYFNDKLNQYDNQIISDLINWYLNKALLIIQSNFDPLVYSNLPKLQGSILPKSDQLLQNKNNNITNANGIPGYKLMTTFKDILLEWCSENGIVMTLLKERFHFLKGYPIYMFKYDNSTIYGYIEDDVLWITLNNNDYESSNYFPIAMEDLINQF
ncbi:hypothetical protein KGF54_002982 [Candida jiufengensis]|uniref:uncharacterized protein n=1 Tax=Candida jiufengensis TaxID=497108 RepID=UPI0022259227|nr:uncharacterized protein KGF54_002982 [Candida jiufengensis]KAI5953610.1 hypothetical protein KGF54_002982 [Candida jiufengensis]